MTQKVNCLLAILLLDLAFHAWLGGWGLGPTFTYNTIVVLLGVTLLGASSGLIGTFAVLRRRSLTGDALAHASLPGLCLAFLIVGGKSLPAMLLGALATGLVGVSIISALTRYTRVKEDAAIGIVLSVFFGAGVVLSQIIQRQPGGGKAGLESYIFGTTAGMSLQDLAWLTALSVVTLAAVLLLYKEFKLVAFDPEFAQSQGWPVYLLDLLLMGLIAVNVVVGLPAVGVLMVAALLVVPAATARFWTDRLDLMLILSACFGVLAAARGTILSAAYSGLPAGPAIILEAVGLFLLSGLLAPGRGLWGGKLQRMRVFGGERIP